MAKKSGSQVGSVKYLTAAIKSVEEKDDGLYIQGCLAAEEVDDTGEVMDWETSIPHFKSWNRAFAEKTANAEGGISVGNLRIMHQRIAAGKFVAMDYDEDAKKVLVTAKVTNEAEKKNVREGIYTAFSVGAKYMKKWYDSTLKAVRWTAKPFEGSLVDIGAMPSANGFTYRAIDGTEETKQFDGGRRALREAFEAAMFVVDGKVAKGTLTTSQEDRFVARAAKGLYGVSNFAQLMQSLIYLRESIAYEREQEGDDSPVTDRISEATDELLECLAAYTQEEISEEITKDKSKEASMKLEDIAKKRAQLKADLDAADAEFKAAGGKDEDDDKCMKSEEKCTDEKCKTHGAAVKKRNEKAKDGEKAATGGEEVALKRADVIELIGNTIDEKLKPFSEGLQAIADAVKTIGSAPALSLVHTRGFVVTKDEDGKKEQDAKKAVGDLAGEGKTRDAILLARQNPTFIAGARS
ncbi:MAG TPA: hypothetical protein VNT29_02010 [Candidatus Limnocylindrales bacterium]|nr:hypothetical protein [Candidatus Limnocylindrales bacterium]